VPRSLRHQAKCLWVVEIYIFHFALQLNISSWQKGPDFSAVQLNGRPAPHCIKGWSQYIISYWMSNIGKVHRYILIIFFIVLK